MLVIVSALGASLLSACAPDTGMPDHPPGSQAAVAAATESSVRRPPWTPDAAHFPGREPLPAFVPGELLVKFRPGTAKSRSDALLRNASVRFSRSFRSVPGLLRVALTPGTTIQAARASLEGQSEVEYAEPNWLYYPHRTPNDTWFRVQSHLEFLGGGEAPPDSDIDAPEAWDITTGSDDVVVAVLDTGIFPRQGDLAANVFRNEADCDADGMDDDANGYVDDCNGIDAYDDDNDPTDYTIHGTHVAGTIGAVTDNANGVAGVAWHVRILPCRFIDFNRGGKTSDAVECFDYVAMMKDRGVNIIATNNSWGNIYPSRSLTDAIGRQLARGILTIASAGNDSLDNDREPVFPCNADHANVICVSSSSFLHVISSFSNYGDQSVHLAAPGEYVYSTTSGDGTNDLYDYLTGTSMAAPQVTGTAVLLAAQDPSRDWRALRNLLLSGTEAVDEEPRRTISGGRLNAYGSLTCANRTVTRRLKPEFRHHVVSGGTTIPLRALNINCAAPNGTIAVNVSPTAETVTLKDNGLGDDEVAGDGVYNGHWVAPAEGGEYELVFQTPIGDVINVEVDPFLKVGFPLKGMDSGWFAGFWDGPWHEVIAGNIDADPELEVLIPSVSSGPLFAYNHDGTGVPGFPIIDEGGQPYVALGEFDGDPSQQEIALNAFWTFGVSLYTGRAELMPGGWPHSGFLTVPPTAADIDGDGLDEIILYPAYRADGSVFAPDVRLPLWGEEDTSGGLPTTIAAADFDGDNLPEMIVARPESLWASTQAGIANGFPVVFPEALRGDGFPVVPVAGDVDADGRTEIVIAAPLYDGALYAYRLLVYSSRGELKWSREIDAVPPSQVAPVLADLDGDGVPEILAQSAQYIHAWRGDGSPAPGWPVFLGQDSDSRQSTPVVGDIDGDGMPDVVTTAADTSAPWAGKTYIYHRDGRAHDGYPRALLSYRFGMAAAIADIDLNGRNDLLVAPTSVPGVSDTLYGYDYNGGRPSGPIEWGQFMEGPSNHGYYELGKNLPDDAFVVAFAHGAGTVTGLAGGIDCGGDCIEKVGKGTRARFKATATAGATFTGWVGDCAGQGSTCEITVAGLTHATATFDSPVAVHFTGSGSGRVISTPSRLDCTSDCSKVFASRTYVELMPTPSAGDGFDGWSGDCSNVSGPCRLYIDAAKDVTANFTHARELSVTHSGSGGGRVTSSPAGIDCGANCIGGFAPDRPVTLIAAAAQGSEFRGWSGDCRNGGLECTVTMDAAKSVNAQFDLQPIVTVTTTGGGRVVSSPAGIDCGATCSAPFPFDESLELTAVADFEVRFEGWTGACESANPLRTCYILVADQPVTVGATFAAAPRLDVALQGLGSGRVRSDPPGIDCTSSCFAEFAQGQAVRITATAAGGSQFAGWSGDCSGTAPECVMTMDSSRTAYARFEPRRTTDGGGGGGGGGAVGWIALLGLAGLRRLKGA